MKEKITFTVKEILAMTPFFLVSILIIIATGYDYRPPASIVGCAMASACLLSADSLAKLRKKAQSSLADTIEKYSRKDDYFAFYSSIFKEYNQITNCQDYLDKSEKLFTQKSPFVGKKIDIYYEKGTLHARQKSRKEFEELSRSTAQNNFSTWKKSQEKLTNEDIAS